MKHSFPTHFRLCSIASISCLTFLAGCSTNEVLAAPALSVRVKVTTIAGKAPEADQKFKLTWGNAVEFSGGDWSEWSQFDGYNGEDWLEMRCRVEPDPAIAPFPRLKLEVETSIADGEKSPNKAELFGPLLALMVWKHPDGLHIDTTAGHQDRVYGPYFKAAEIPVNERPAHFVRRSLH